MIKSPSPARFLRRSILGLALAALAIATPSAAPPAVPAAAPAADAGMLRATLDNGLRVVIVRNALAPVVTTEINYLVGSNEAPAGFPGTAHAQEHMMFRGSPGLTADQLSTISAAMGGDFDADTQQTVTQYFFTVPSADADIALHIGAVRMAGVDDTEAEWQKERGAIEQEVASDLSNPGYHFYTELLAHMFAGTPYAYDALGTRPSFDKTTGAMLKQFHDTWYAPNNAILVVVGDVDPAATLATIKQLFGPIPRGDVPKRPAVTLEPLKPQQLTLDTDLPYGLSVVAYRLPGYASKDFAAGEILSDVLGSTRGNIYALGPEGKALGAGFEGQALPEASIGYALAAFPKGGDGSGLVTTLKDVIADYVKNGVPADLVEASKRHELASAQFARNSVPGLASQWSQALAVEGRQSPDEDLDAIRAVTVDDVNRVARAYLDNTTATTAVLTPQPSGKPVSSKGFQGKESFTPKVTGPVTLPAWAARVTDLPPVPAATVKPTVETLPNGLRLIVQPETISHTISVFGVVKHNGDLQTPKDQEGVGDVLDSLFEFGTTSLDRLAFQKALDDIAADESAGASFSLQVLSEHFDRGMQLLAQNVRQPALPAPAFAIVQRQTAGSLAGELQSPSYLARRAMGSLLYPKDDPSQREATPQTVGALTLADVKAYYAQIFRPDMTTIVIVGDTTPAAARAVVAKYFGDWTATGPKPETLLPAVPLNQAGTTAVPDTSRVQDQVTLAETIGLTRENPDRYALEVGNHVLSGAFYATRLYHDLREEAGLVYSVDSSFNIGRRRSTFAVSYACDPPNVSKARAMVVKDLEAMQTSPVTPVELQRAKTLLVQQIPLSESSVNQIGYNLLGLAEADLPLDEPTRAAQHYLAITAHDVQQAFAKWLRPAAFAQVSLGPEPK
ncbi:MAG: insulinase family protein [Acidobacteriota bacterium]|nr:insulinase family protein [Acidobacteriota bacterium]